MKDSFQIGTYQLGWRWVDVYVDPDSLGGKFEGRFGGRNMPECPRPIMTIGIENMDFHNAMEVATHEAIEFAACDLGVRFRPTWSYEDHASDCYVFSFDHNKLTEISARTGNFLCQIHDDLKAAIALLNEASQKAAP